MGSKRVRHDWVTSTFTEVYEVTLDFLISLSPYFLIMLKEMLNGLDFQSIFIPTINFLTKNMYEAWGSCLLSVHLYAVSYLILNKQVPRQLSKQVSSKYSIRLFYQYPSVPLRYLWRRKWQPTPVFLPGIPWTEEPDGLQSMRSKRVRHDWVTSTFREVYEWHLIFPYLYDLIFLLCWKKYWMA